MCGKCGAALEIIEDDHQKFTGYSPFSAEEYIIKRATGDPSIDQKQKDGSQNKDAT
jgi:hypothetical protein